MDLEDIGDVMVLHQWVAASGMVVVGIRPRNHLQESKHHRHHPPVAAVAVSGEVEALQEEVAQEDPLAVASGEAVVAEVAAAVAVALVDLPPGGALAQEDVAVAPLVVDDPLGAVVVDPLAEEALPVVAVPVEASSKHPLIKTNQKQHGIYLPHAVFLCLT